MAEVQSCFNTQPPEGGWAYIGDDGEITIKFQHTAARRRLGFRIMTLSGIGRFQHTAARRRLDTSFQTCTTL